MNLYIKPLTEINQQALRILYKEIGIVNTIRFINQFTISYGNYTEEHNQIFGDMTLKDIVSDIEQMRIRDIQS
jgi:hypothetical protein